VTRRGRPYVRLTTDGPSGRARDHPPPGGVALTF
jgi:hypothetical protein